MTSHKTPAETTVGIPEARTSAEGTDRDDEKPEDGTSADPASAGTEPDSRRRPRRSPLRRAVKAGTILLAVLAFLALGDRWAVLFAENLVADKMRDELKLRAAPEVHIDAFPFVPRLALGRVPHVEADVPHLPAGPVSIGKVKGTVDDVRILGFPTSVKGAELGRLRGDVFLDFADLDREVGASRVHLTKGPGDDTVLARGGLPVAGEQAQVRGRAHIRRTGDRSLAMTVRDTKVVVPGLLTYVPGEGGGLQLAAPAADKVDEKKVRRKTGKRIDPDRMLKGGALDALADHPSLLKPAGVDPALLRGLRKVSEPKAAKPMEFSARLPDDLPGDIRLRAISVTQDGVRAELTGEKAQFGG